MCSSIELEVTAAFKAFGVVFLFFFFFSLSRAVGAFGTAASRGVRSFTPSPRPEEAASPSSASDTRGCEAGPKQEMPQALLMES